MSISKLNQLFNHVQLEYSLDQSRLKELKQLLLLELKGSATEYLTIEGVSWSKNDILTYFETDFSSVKEFDLVAFFSQFPPIELLKDCKQINSFYNLEPAKKHQDFELFREQESPSFLEGFLKEMRARFQSKDFTKISQLSNFFSFFNEECQHKIIELVKYQVKSILLERLNRNDLNKKSKLALFTFPSYYKLLLDVLSKETTFLNDQYDLFIENIDGVDIDTAISIGLKQKQLPLGETEKTFLEINLKQWRSQRVKGVEKSESKSTNFRIIYFIVIAIIFVMRMIHSNTSSNYSNNFNNVNNISTVNNTNMLYDQLKERIFDSTFLYEKLYLKPTIDSSENALLYSRELEALNKIHHFAQILIELKEERELDSILFDSQTVKKNQCIGAYNGLTFSYTNLMFVYNSKKTEY